MHRMMENAREVGVARGLWAQQAEDALRLALAGIDEGVQALLGVDACEIAERGRPWRDCLGDALERARRDIDGQAVGAPV